MKLSIRTLDQRNICLDLDNELLTVLQLKQRLVQLPEIKQPLEQLQLIYAGTIMQDDEPLQHYNIEEGKFLVLMSKSSVKQQPKEETPQQPEGEQIMEPPVQPAVVPPPSLTPNEQLVAELIAMGYEEPQVRQALQASFNHPERAIEYLISGIPSNTVEVTSSPASAPTPAATATPASTPATALAAASPIAPDHAAYLQLLANNTSFARLRDMIREQPQLLEVLLTHLHESEPQMFEAIHNHQDEFIALLNAAPQVEAPQLEEPHLQLSSVEEAAVQRLMALGFDRETVLQVYVACDKNEELTADILCSQTEDEDEFDDDDD